MMAGGKSLRAAMVVAISLAGGCVSPGGDLRVLGDALDALAGELDRTVQEYHEDLNQFDHLREQEVVQAFVQRVRQSESRDPAEASAHAEALAHALARIQADREASLQRLSAAQENTASLREIAAGLRTAAARSSSLVPHLGQALESSGELDLGTTTGTAVRRRIPPRTPGRSASGNFSRSNQ
jgi:hypothetical protein